MPLILESPADIANAAFGRLPGAVRRIGTPYDGTRESKAFLDIYGQTRDNLLRSEDWGFAGRDVSLVLQKTAPVTGYGPWHPWNPVTDPMLPWIYQYALPPDYIKVRSVRQTPQFVPEYAPSAVVYGLENDPNIVPQQQVLLCNLAGAILNYTAQVTDPKLWNASFTEALIAALARRLAPTLAGLDAEKAEAQDEVASEARAVQIVG